MRLGVNIDHVATIRQARCDVYPDLTSAAQVAVDSGAEGITIHLREDRRHIQDSDVYAIRNVLSNTHLNLELAAVDEIADIAIDAKVNAACIVPEKREEITTEGGLDVVGNFEQIKKISNKLSSVGIEVSHFIDPEEDQIKAAKESGAEYIELHTGTYAEYSDSKRDSYDKEKTQLELDKLLNAARFAKTLGLKVNAGHGLTYENTKAIANHPELFEELNIGHNIIARAMFVGLSQAITEMKKILTN